MGLGELLERDDLSRNLLQSAAIQCAYDGLAGDLLEKGVRLPIEHDQIGVPQHPGYSEFEFVVSNPAIKHQRAVAQRTESDRNRDVCDAIVDDFVPNQDLEWIRSGLLFYRKRDHGLTVSDPFFCFVNRHEPGRIDGRNCIARHIGFQLIQIDGRSIPIGPPVGLNPAGLGFDHARARQQATCDQ